VFERRWAELDRGLRGGEMRRSNQRIVSLHTLTHTLTHHSSSPMTALLCPPPPTPSPTPQLQQRRLRGEAAHRVAVRQGEGG
jgi:hypothetical protein